MDQADRDKTLDMAMSQIERQFGKGAIMKLSDSAVKNVEAIPTGALSLDLALGIGGVPRGRVVEIYGPESSGKCLVADTHLWTDHGLETVGEFFDRLGQPASCTSRITDVSEFGARVVNERGELETVTALTHNNRRPVVEITLRSGRAVKVTMNHPLRVLNDRGAIVWREAKEISAGDTLVSATFGAVEATGGDHLSEDEARLARLPRGRGYALVPKNGRIHQQGRRSRYRVLRPHGPALRCQGQAIWRQGVPRPQQGNSHQTGR